MGVETQNLDAEKAAVAAITAIRKLYADVRIPNGLIKLGVKADYIPTLAANAMQDACGLYRVGRGAVLRRHVGQFDVASTFESLNEVGTMVFRRSRRLFRLGATQIPQLAGTALSRFAQRETAATQGLAIHLHARVKARAGARRGCGPSPGHLLQ